jgi:hypothetical protein
MTMKPEPVLPKFRYLVLVKPSMADGGDSGGFAVVGYELLPVAGSESNAMIGFPGARIGVGAADAIAAPTNTAATAQQTTDFLTTHSRFSALQQNLALTREADAPAFDVSPLNISPTPRARHQKAPIAPI